jgi:hypothetical protein
VTVINFVESKIVFCVDKMLENKMFSISGEFNFLSRLVRYNIKIGDKDD